MKRWYNTQREREREREVQERVSKKVEAINASKGNNSPRDRGNAQTSSFLSSDTVKTESPLCHQATGICDTQAVSLYQHLNLGPWTSWQREVWTSRWSGSWHWISNYECHCPNFPPQWEVLGALSREAEEVEEESLWEIPAEVGQEGMAFPCQRCPEWKQNVRLSERGWEEKTKAVSQRGSDPVVVKTVCLAVTCLVFAAVLVLLMAAAVLQYMTCLVKEPPEAPHLHPFPALAVATVAEARPLSERCPLLLCCPPPTRSSCHSYLEQNQNSVHSHQWSIKEYQSWANDTETGNGSMEKYCASSSH